MEFIRVVSILYVNIIVSFERKIKGAIITNFVVGNLGGRQEETGSRGSWGSRHPCCPRCRGQTNGDWWEICTSQHERWGRERSRGGHAV